MQMDAFCLHGEKAFYLVRIKGASKDDFFSYAKEEDSFSVILGQVFFNSPSAPPFPYRLVPIFPIVSAHPLLEGGPSGGFFSLFSAGFNQFFL